MRTKDITLSASVMAIYLAIQLVAAASPVKITSIMTSALFGLFYPFFSLRINLAFHGLRVGWNMIGLVREGPKIINYMKMEAIIGLQFLGWINETQPGDIYVGGYELLASLSQIGFTFNLGIVVFLYSMIFCFVLPYFFYRIFRYLGVFRRLPSF